MPMRPLLLICLTALLAASPPAGAQTLDDAARAVEKKEYARARDMLEKLAQQGNIEAEVRLADMYVRPMGIPKNTERGIALYESAARKGHPGALFILGTELIKGGLLKPDKKRALGLLFTSAKLKYAAAQVTLCFELSIEGTSFYNAVEAYAWCETASHKDHRQAREAGRRAKDLLRKIGEVQKAEDLHAAKIRAAGYAKAY